MDEYIKRNEIIKMLEERLKDKYRSLKNATYVEDINEIGSEIDELKVLIEIIELDIPAADVAPVKHGHWITDSVEFYKLLNAKGVPLEEQPYLTSDCVACSECMRVINCMDNCMEDALYCKYCGAKMDRKDKNSDD